MATFDKLKRQLLKRRRLLVGTAVLATLISVVRIDQGKLKWADWTGIGADSTINTERDNKGNIIKTVEIPQSGKTLWDWLSLLGVPISLTAFGVWLQKLQQEQAAKEARLEKVQTEHRTNLEKEIAEGNQREEALQAYFDRLSTLLIDKNLIAVADKVKKTVKMRSIKKIQRWMSRKI